MQARDGDTAETSIIERSQYKAWDTGKLEEPVSQLTTSEEAVRYERDVGQAAAATAPFRGFRMLSPEPSISGDSLDRLSAIFISMFKSCMHMPTQQSCTL